MTGVFRHTDTEASHVTTVAEIGAMLPQAKDTWGHQTLERVRKDSLPETSGVAWPCWHLDFGLLASRTVRQYIYVVLSP